ncbi:hypothetical protein DB321_07380 [Ligilactobacillus salivarius]|uniref:Uncharacterized protein n=2 Tax=Ligilactobacillus salivarius TaxID=1624 RepID=C2EIG2_9LACO|nr:hypothetical protein [Ligilactobacillus salivarius]ATP38289.1 hypothetical protein CR531_09005 [Ligilactobacillus salivarius]EEJ73690.1 hypothetical protein HMPREF0545_1434 [Ligilactobacillus salivarius DSM 20555 = ATCC 11741]KRM69059.1 hypothetical protein FC55_GL000438 [Ligilactobacillus salivarius DSM 20555 = ATCC 11741]MBE7938429.1 hypothetical protein [Ligilactobacillus salivarius]MDG9755526.1 hypothetical protein [Ligilactobacillus salivarius]
MNENIKAMVSELKREFPDNYGNGTKGLYFEISDNHYFEYGVDKEFTEQHFSDIWIRYKGNGFKIIYENDLECEIETEYYPNLENLEAIGRIINIVGKNLSKINFDY